MACYISEYYAGCNISSFDLKKLSTYSLYDIDQTKAETFFTSIQGGLT